MINAIVLAFLVSSTPATRFSLDKTATIPGQEVVATATYTIPASQPNGKILNSLVIGVSQYGNYVTFTNTSRTDSLDSSGNKVIVIVSKFTFNSPLGTWKVTPKYRIETGVWTVVNSASITLTLSKTVVDSGGGSTGTSGPTGPTGTTTPPPVPVAGDWLTTRGNHIVKSDGTIWMGRGVNLFDTRGCNACSTRPPDVNEVKRRIDEIVKWGGNFIRLVLESGLDSPLLNYRPITQDTQYLADIKTITDYVMTKPGLYMEVSLWIDSSFSNFPVAGWPTVATIETWKILATTLKDNPRLMYGLVNEPQSNFSGTYDAQCWTAMNNAVQAIRDVEAALGTPNHLIAVQGTRGWARELGYYVTHPITAGGGLNVVYETHVYDPQADFPGLFENPAKTLPVIIGEFGPVDWAGMFLPDTQALMTRAEAIQVPYLAWSFHGRCPPNLLVDNSNGGCGIGMTLVPTPWGTQLKNQLAKPLQ